MSGALDSFRDGFPVSIHFNLANLAQGATTAMTIPGQANTGYLVPTGYKFVPMLLALASNADLTAGSSVAKVTDNGTAIAGGPEPTLSDLVQQATAVARNTQSAGIAAGHAIGVKLTGDGSYAPATADYDALLSGVMIPT